MLYVPNSVRGGCVEAYPSSLTGAGGLGHTEPTNESQELIGPGAHTAGTTVIPMRMPPSIAPGVHGAGFMFLTHFLLKAFTLYLPGGPFLSLVLWRADER